MIWSHNERSDQFEVIEFPAILEIEDEETGQSSGKTAMAGVL